MNSVNVKINLIFGKYLTMENFPSESEHSQNLSTQPYWMNRNANPLKIASPVGDYRDDDEQFSVSVDVSHFTPNEIKVTATNTDVVVEGKHSERSDEHGRVERHFIRKYALPKSMNPEAIVSSLSRDGVLTVSAPKKPQIETSTTRVIPIVADSSEKLPKASDS